MLYSLDLRCLFLKNQQVTVDEQLENAFESEVESEGSDIGAETTESETPSHSSPEGCRNWMLARDITKRVSKVPAK